MTVEALRLANGLRHATGDVIYEGQEIRVPVTDGNRDKIELIRAKAIVAKEQAIARAAAERARKTGNKQGARKQDKAPDGSEAWRAPYRSMRRGEVTAVTRAEVEAMMPKPGPSPPGLEHARGLRDADVVLLNTCAIRENAESKIWQRLRTIRAEKRKWAAGWRTRGERSARGSTW